jgi:hypothetical protein
MAKEERERKMAEREVCFSPEALLAVVGHAFEHMLIRNS